MRKFLASLLEIFEIALIAVGSVFLVRTFLIQPFVVSGSSMAPNFGNGDYLLVDELTYRFRTPQRGEVVVFRYENNSGAYFIKRIIGLPGEHVSIKNNIINIIPQNGEPIILKEPYIPSSTPTSGSAEYSLNGNQYFVLGDNRSFSFDSRNWGALNAKDIIGLVRVRLWPFGEAVSFPIPQYQ